MKETLHLKSLTRFLCLCLVLFGIQASVFAQTTIIPKLYLPSRNTPSGDTGWTITSAPINNAGTDYWKMITTTSSLTSPVMNFSSYTAISMALNLQSFGGVSGNINKVKVEYNDGTSWIQVGSLLAVTSSAGTQTVSLPYTSATSQIRVTTPNASGAAGARLMSIQINGTVANQAPTATDVAISGTFLVGETITGTYTYTDNETNPEGVSTFKWYRADDAAGTAEVAITDATASTYLLDVADVNKYIRFSVVPLATAGTTTGVEAFSTRELVQATAAPFLAISGTTGHGATCTGSPATTIQYTITNSGTAAATGVTVNSDNTDFVVNGLSSTTIAVDGTATYNVTFTPSTNGAKTATITATSSASGSNSATSSLTGTGTATVAQAVTTTAASAIGSSVVTLNGSLTAAGNCPTITEKGFVYALTAANSDPIEGGTGVTKVPVSGITTGVYSNITSGLTATSGYSYKAYAFNGTAYTYGTVQTFTTLMPPVDPPVAQNAGNIENNAFTANWTAVTGATGYSLDVSTTAAFVTSGAILTEGFESTTFPPAGWLTTSFTRSTLSADIATGSGAATAGASTGTLTTPALAHPTSLTFNLGRTTNATVKTLDIEVSTTDQTTGFTTVTTYDHNNVAGGTYIQYTVDLSAYTASPVVYIRFKKTSTTTSPWRLDNIVVNATNSGILPDYNGKVISGQSTVTAAVTGLNANTNYYYRVRATNTDNTSANSNVITTTTVANAIWDGSQWSNITGPSTTSEAIIEGVYNTTTNGVFTAKSLTLNSGTFTVASGTNVTIVNNVTNTLAADKFIVENNANLIQNGTVNDNTGNITVQRNANMRQLDYVYWSAPVAAQNLQAFSMATLVGRFYTIDEPTNSFQSAGAATNSFSLAKGYVIRAPNNFLPAPAAPQLFTGFFVGKPNNGDITIPVTVLGGGYNLIGNPYPSTVNADLFLADAANQNIETLYFWTHMTTVGGGTNYATYNATGAAGATPSDTDPASGTPNGFIQTGQGFIAKTTSAGNATFKNSMRAANNSGQFFRTADVIEKNRIWLNLSNANTSFNQSLIGYISDATDGIDTKFDGLLIETNGTRLYNVINNTEYVIQGKALPFNNTDVVALGFKAAAAGTYTISIDHVDGLFSADQDIFIKDKLTNTVNNLKSAAYTFASEEGTFNERFEIIYQNTVLGIENPVLNAESIVVYKQNNTLNINAGTTVMAGVKIFDIRGRLIFERNNINATTTAISDLTAEQQVLIVQMTSSDNKTVSKKLVY